MSEEPPPARLHSATSASVLNEMTEPKLTPSYNHHYQPISHSYSQQSIDSLVKRETRSSSVTSSLTATAINNSGGASNNSGLINKPLSSQVTSTTSTISNNNKPSFFSHADKKSQSVLDLSRLLDQEQEVARRPGHLLTKRSSFTRFGRSADQDRTVPEPQQRGLITRRPLKLRESSSDLLRESCEEHDETDRSSVATAAARQQKDKPTFRTDRSSLSRPFSTIERVDSKLSAAAAGIVSGDGREGSPPLPPLGKKLTHSRSVKELARRWHSIASESSSPEIASASSDRCSTSPLEKTPSRESSSEKLTGLGSPKEMSPLPTVDNDITASATASNTGVTASDDSAWPEFDVGSAKANCDRKYSVPSLKNPSTKLREKRDNVPSRPLSLIESSEQKDLKVFAIGNLGDTSRQAHKESGSQISSRDVITDSLLSEMSASSLPGGAASSAGASTEILEAFTSLTSGGQVKGGSSRRAVSVNDIRRAFEKAEQSLAAFETSPGGHRGSAHHRISSFDSSTSEESGSTVQNPFGSGLFSLLQ